MIRSSRRSRPLAVLFAIALAAVSSLSIAGAASAYGGEQGYLLIHGPGTAFAGPDSYNNVTTTAGGTGTITFAVKNTGPSTSQFLLEAYDFAENCSSCAPAKMVVTPGPAGTAAAMLGSGYFTPPIDPGKTLTFTMKVTPPTGTAAGTVYDVEPFLFDTSGVNQLSEAFASVSVTASTGTAPDDQFVTGAGSQKPVAQVGGVTPLVSDPSAKPNATSVFTVKLQNDSAVTDRIAYQLTDTSGCGAAFPATVKVGTTDITSAALGGSYQTPLLAKGKFTTLTVTVTAAGSLSQCTHLQNASFWLSYSHSGNTVGHGIYLVTNPVAS